MGFNPDKCDAVLKDVDYVAFLLIDYEGSFHFITQLFLLKPDLISIERQEEILIFQLRQRNKIDASIREKHWSVDVPDRSTIKRLCLQIDETLSQRTELLSYLTMEKDRVNEAMRFVRLRKFKGPSTGIRMAEN
uniref:Uncharacterized protein n=1 Tax=Solanum lycopersicum TaxID=4081 RepID=A0A3Q7G955_SOLLC